MVWGEDSTNRGGNKLGVRDDASMNRGDHRQAARGADDDDALTIQIQRTLGTRGNFSLVSRYQRLVVIQAWLLPVRGVPKDVDLGR